MFQDHLAHLRALAINAADQFWKRGQPVPILVLARLDALDLDVQALEARYAIGRPQNCNRTIAILFRRRETRGAALPST